ncbi:hypothetical protein OE88DRAFT_1659659 [Heliocybe sulcata]|uniref:Uncharacterized protein n=1 Tax=Heliocybe sulcata TaxID=5364 RepID=A0A5C3N3C5_9AGAM|nr:hypothetical protein OE88DRAFT_1659659 [Heliocybe sulcata]
MARTCSAVIHPPLHLLILLYICPGISSVSPSELPGMPQDESESFCHGHPVAVSVGFC